MALKPLKFLDTQINQSTLPFQGKGTIDIRREIDNGAVIVNYYGHGGGLQWDLVFTNDDIYELNNGDKLPL